MSPATVPPVAKPKMVMRSLRVPEKLWEAAKAKADERQENISDVIREALERYVKKGEAMGDRAGSEVSERAILVERWDARGVCHTCGHWRVTYCNVNGFHYCDAHYPEELR